MSPSAASVSPVGQQDNVPSVVLKHTDSSSVAPPSAPPPPAAAVLLVASAPSPPPLPAADLPEL